MANIFWEKGRKAYKKYGFWGCVKRLPAVIGPNVKESRMIWYPYARWRVPRVIEKLHDPTSAVDFALYGVGRVIAPLQVRSEFLALTELVAALKPKTVLELGTARGGSLFVWARMATQDAHLVSIDIGAGNDFLMYPRWKEPFYRSFASKGQTITLLRGDAQDEEIFEKCKATLGGAKVDLLFIDADHSYLPVKKDYERYAPLVRKGGMIAFHDIEEVRVGIEVKLLWDEIKQGKRFQEIIEKGRGVGIGVLYQ